MAKDRPNLAHLLPDFVNPVWLEHNHARYLYIIYGYFQPVTAEPIWPTKAKIFSWLFTESVCWSLDQTIKDMARYVIKNKTKLMAVILWIQWNEMSTFIKCSENLWALKKESVSSG
jgi:hypothetical protein